MAEKSLFPEEMMSSGSFTLESIAGKLTYFHEQLHLLHWQTFGGFEHEATSDLYNLIFNIKDEIIEKIMGYSGNRIKVFKIDSLKPYSEGFSNKLCLDIIKFCKELEIFGEKNDMPDICNISQSLSGDVAKIKYRLTLK